MRIIKLQISDFFRRQISKDTVSISITWLVTYMWNLKLLLLEAESKVVIARRWREEEILSCFSRDIVLCRGEQMRLHSVWIPLALSKLCALLPLLSHDSSTTLEKHIDYSLKYTWWSIPKALSLRLDLLRCNTFHSYKDKKSQNREEH